MTFNGDAEVYGCAFQTTGTGTNRGMLISTTDCATAPHNITISNCIGLPTPDGYSPGIILAQGCNITQSPNYPIAYIEHNVVAVGTLSGVDCTGVNSPFLSDVGTIASLRSNVFWRTGASHPGSYSLDNHNSTPYVDVVSAADADYNGWYGLATVPAGTYRPSRTGRSITRR
jgi:hypothetical protein